uniref:Exportin-1 C-terminal domain-containing protein n=1 Tax=Physcomitrium patens TaxID=3218 RepID=A0A2K1L1S3_PHYPA|nr:hypothetical protein PHYPA_002769 [Physcomitrium patens]
MLKLIKTFADKAEDVELIAKNFVPTMMHPILGDNARNVSDARESEDSPLFATIISKLKGAMMDVFSRIFEVVFACTLEVFTGQFVWKNLFIVLSCSTGFYAHILQHSLNLDNKLVYKREAERRRMLSIPEVVAPSELHDDMIDT